MPLSYENVFSLINLAVLPAWLLLALLPKSDVTRAVVHSGLYPLLLGVFYAVTLVMGFAFGYGAEGGTFNTAAGVSQVFSHPHGILIGWSHYLVFDLFVGAWIARDAQRRGIDERGDRAADERVIRGARARQRQIRRGPLGVGTNVLAGHCGAAS